jgi:hypothetical protein
MNLYLEGTLCEFRPLRLLFCEGFLSLLLSAFLSYTKLAAIVIVYASVVVCRGRITRSIFLRYTSFHLKCSFISHIHIFNYSHCSAVVRTSEFAVLALHVLCYLVKEQKRSKLFSVSMHFWALIWAPRCVLKWSVIVKRRHETIGVNPPTVVNTTFVLIVITCFNEKNAVCRWTMMQQLHCIFYI